MMEIIPCKQSHCSVLGAQRRSTYRGSLMMKGAGLKPAFEHPVRAAACTLRKRSAEDRSFRVTIHLDLYFYYGAGYGYSQVCRGPPKSGRRAETQDLSVSSIVSPAPSIPSVSPSDSCAVLYCLMKRQASLAYPALYFSTRT